MMNERFNRTVISYLAKMDNSERSSLLAMLKDTELANQKPVKKAQYSDTVEYKIYPKHGYILADGFMKKTRRSILWSRLNTTAKNCGTKISIEKNKKDKLTGKVIYGLYKVEDASKTQMIADKMDWTITQEDIKEKLASWGIGVEEKAQ
jgi:hypothetical protein